MALTWFKNGNEYRTLDGRWTIWGDDRRGFSLDHTLDDGERISWSVPGAFDSVGEAKKQAERASRKSLPATATGAKALKSDAYEAGRKANAEGVDYLNSPYSYRERHLPDAAEWQRGWMDAEREKRSTKSLELRAKYKAVSDTSEFRPIPNFRWNGQTWAHNGKIGTEFKTGKPTAQYNSVEKRGSRCWRNIDGVITSDD